jgi:hypothetical protein
MNINNSDEKKLRNDLHEMENGTTSQDLFSLAQVRNNALRQADQSKKRLLWPALGTSLASVALIAVLINPADQIEPAGDINITEIQADEALLDLYEDLDFYHWLASGET